MWIALFLAACGGKSPNPAEGTAVESPGEISLPLPERGYQLTTPTYTVPAFTEQERWELTRDAWLARRQGQGH